MQHMYYFVTTHSSSYISYLRKMEKPQLRVWKPNTYRLKTKNASGGYGPFDRMVYYWYNELKCGRHSTEAVTEKKTLGKYHVVSYWKI